MILPSEYRCQCGAVVYVGNAACPRCRAANPRRAGNMGGGTAGVARYTRGWIN